jgi:hypothetical protein
MALIFLLFLVLYGGITRVFLNKAKKSLEQGVINSINDLSDKESRLTTILLVGLLFIAGLFELLKISHSAIWGIVFATLSTGAFLIMFLYLTNKMKEYNVNKSYIKKYLILKIFMVACLIVYAISLVSTKNLS